MADVTRLHSDVMALLGTLIYNPVKRFLTNDDYNQAIMWAAVQWSTMIGGLKLVDVSTLSVASQSTYSMKRGHRKIRRAFYVKNINLATEERTPLEIKDPDDRAFIERISEVANTDPSDMSLTVVGEAQDKPKYIVPYYELSQFVLLDKPVNAGDTIMLWVDSIGEKLTPGITWDGEAEDVPGIAYLACVQLREKSRDMQDASYWMGKAEAHAEDVKRQRRKARQRTQMAVGESRVRRSRSLFGSRDA